MASPERRGFLNRITRGRLGRTPKTEVTPAVPPMAQQPPLTPEQRAAKVNLAAILNAYDMSSPEEQARMLAEMRETGDTSVGGEAYRRGRAAAQVSELLGESREEGKRRLETLEEAAEQIPGIGNAINLLSEMETEESKEKK